MSQTLVQEKQLIEKSIKITNNSILARLKTYEGDYLSSIAEYIWNAFDANARNVRIDYRFDIDAGGATLGHPAFSIGDDGTGWDMSDQDKIENFLDSDKKILKRPDKSLPHGSKGVGRFTFFSFAKKVKWNSVHDNRSYTLELSKEDMVNYRLEMSEGSSSTSRQSGTTAEFEVDNTSLNKTFFEVGLIGDLEKRFCWFLLLYPTKKIYINGESLKLTNMIGEVKDIRLEVENKQYNCKLVRWNESLLNKENSKLYIKDSKNNEIIKFTTGLNNKRDVFYHSAYVEIPELEGYQISVSDGQNIADDSHQIAFLEGEQNKLLRAIRKSVKEELEVMRRPHVQAKSEDFIDEWREKKLVPDATLYGVSASLYDDFIKKTFVIAPSLYLGVDDEHLKVILSLFASLLGSDRRELTLKLFSQFHDMSDEEKADLEALLEKNSMSSIMSTIKEVDHRLNIIEALDDLVHDPDIFKHVLEVEHLQQIINDEFWIFGEEYRLVVDTEGSIKNAIKKFARDFLEIEDYQPTADSKKELDLLLSKKEEYSGKIKNIVVELKRPSVTLGESELSQLRNYRKQLFKDPACTDENMEWVFILIGRDYDEDIKRHIENARSHGEQPKGLVEYIDSERTKIYVRKWSGTINELRSKHRYLSSRLESRRKDEDSSTIRSNPENIEPAQSKPLIA